MSFQIKSWKQALSCARAGALSNARAIHGRVGLRQACRSSLMQAMPLSIGIKKVIDFS
jgi:hypothetical protein